MLTKRRDALAMQLEAAGADLGKVTEIGTAVAAADAEIAAAEELWLDLSTQLDELR